MENDYDSNVPKTDLPNATAILILGIVSIPTCCCYGIVGLICSIIALVLAKSANNLYAADPGKYTESSYKNMNAGKVCALVGISLSTLVILFYVWLIAAIGFAAFTDPNVIYEYFNIQPPV